jgi:hypothetical protein
MSYKTIGYEGLDLLSAERQKASYRHLNHIERLPDSTNRHIGTKDLEAYFIPLGPELVKLSLTYDFRYVADYNMVKHCAENASAVLSSSPAGARNSSTQKLE